MMEALAGPPILVNAVLVFGTPFWFNFSIFWVVIKALKPIESF